MTIYAIDVSGSMSESVHDQVKDYLRQNGGKDDRVLMFDARVLKVASVGEALSGSPWPIGGGTMLKPVIDWRDQNNFGERLVVLSDGYFCDNVCNLGPIRNSTLVLVEDNKIGDKVCSWFNNVEVL